MAVYLPEIVIHTGARQDPDWMCWDLGRLTDTTVVFGKNGSGKSALLRRWRDSDTPGSHYIAPERGGEIQFQPGY